MREQRLKGPEQKPKALKDEICMLLAAQLDLEGIDPTDNFFELGMNSLDAIGFWKDIEDFYGIQLPVMAIFEHPTVESFAAFVEERLNDPARSERDPSIDIDSGVHPQDREMQHLLGIDIGDSSSSISLIDYPALNTPSTTAVKSSENLHQGSELEKRLKRLVEQTGRTSGEILNASVALYELALKAQEHNKKFGVVEPNQDLITEVSSL